MTHQVIFTSALFDYPTRWDVAFPPDERTRFTTLCTDATHAVGVVVRQYSNLEARFILRGDIKSEKELFICLAKAEKIACHFGCQFLTTQEKVHPEWFGALNMFQSRGFKAIDESWTFNGPFASFADRSRRVVAVLDHKKAIPQEARVSNLVEGQERVRVLLDETLMMDDFEFDNRLKSNALKPISSAYSQIAWHGQKIVGVLLVSPTAESGVFEIPIRYVLPEYRHTWVNAQLIFACVKHGEALGAKFIQFEANAKSHHETLYLAKKSGCERIAIFNRFEKQLY